MTAETDTEFDSRRYKAPALEKGLDVLELVAREGKPLSVSMIATRLGRSMSELFRMIQVLEYRGFIELDPNGEGFVSTEHLFSLGMEKTPVKNMLEIALPVMRELSTQLGQSCHLAVRTDGHIVVVARMESAEQVGFTVRIGHRKPIAETASGSVLYAFQQESVRARWWPFIEKVSSPEALKRLTDNADKIRERGYEKLKSRSVLGLTDISAPVLRGATAAAALTVPFVHFVDGDNNIDAAIKYLRASAASISASLLIADHRI